MKLLLTKLHDTKMLLDGVWGIVCLVGVPSLFVLAGLWYLEPAHGATIRSKFVPTLYTRAGESTRIVSEVEVSMPSLKVAYQFTLHDKKGHTVYTWPAVTPADGKLPTFGDLEIKIPSHLRVGEYQLGAEITYMLNPIKRDNVRVALANVSISDSELPMRYGP